MANLVPYINFVDKSHEALEFYKAVFGGDAEVQSDGGRVMHFDFQSGDIHFMGSDHQGDYAGMGSPKDYTLLVNCDSEQQLRDFYAKLVAGGKEVYAPMDSGFGSIAAHCSDQFGVVWMLNYDLPS